MSKTAKRKNQQIVTFHPLTKQAFILKDKKVTPYDINNSSNKNFYSSFIYAKETIWGTVELDEKVPQNNLHDAILFASFKTLHLDMADEYKIIFSPINKGGYHGRVFDVFAIKKTKLKEIFKDFLHQSVYIDYISVAPFLIQSLYQRGILRPNGTECFIYFQEGDAFLSVYKDGEYLFYRALNAPLSKMGETYQHNLAELFPEIFSYLSDVITLFERSFNDEKIQRVYIGSEFGAIKGAKEYSQNHLGIKTLDFNFMEDSSIEQSHTLVLLSSKAYMDNPNENINFTIFKKPPTFFKKASTQLFIALFVGFILSLAYPVYNYAYGYALQSQSLTKEREYSNMNAKVKVLKSRINMLKKEKKEVLTRYQKEDTKLRLKKRLLEQIDAKKSNYTMKGVMLYDLLQMVHDKNIHLTTLTLQNNRVTTSLFGLDHRQFTKLFKTIDETGRYVVTANKIVFDRENNYYSSLMTTNLKNRKKQ